MTAVLSILVSVLMATTPLAPGDIEGQVRAGTRPDLAHATIQLLREQRVVEERLIGANGRFEFRNLSVGYYVIRVRVESYLEEEVSVFVRSANSREVLMIELRPITKIPESGAKTMSIADYQIPRAARREYEQGLEDRKRGQCAKAIPHLQKAIAAFDKYGAAFIELGNCFKETGDFGKAEESFQKAIEHTNTIFPWMSLADLYAARNRFADAQDVLRRSISKYPTEGDLHFAMARLYFDRGSLKEAEEAALQAHSMLHRMADVHLLLAKLYLSLEKYPALVTQLRTYLDENPRGPVADRVRKNLAELPENK